MKKKKPDKADKKAGINQRTGDLNTSKIKPAPNSVLKTLDDSSHDDFNLSMHNDFTESTPKQVKTARQTPKSILIYIKD